MNPETYAICKADLLIKGEDEGNIAFGSTLSGDAFQRLQFNFMAANPPYGKSWKTDLDRLCGGDKGEMRDPRFVVSHDGNNEFSLVTRSSDGQLMFLANMLSEMKDDPKAPIGSRVATVHNGSALFTGDAGQGESNIRQWILENDWLECIIGLPENLFYNTGIATYIWVLTNRKPKNRRGKVQLIDATQLFTKLRKNLGQKNCRFSDEQIDQIIRTFLDFKETEQSKIFDNADFGYWQITVERSLRLRVDFTAAGMKRFRQGLRRSRRRRVPQTNRGGVQAGWPGHVRRLQFGLGRGESRRQGTGRQAQRQTRAAVREFSASGMKRPNPSSAARRS